MKIQLLFKTPDAVYQALQDVPEEDRDRAKQILDKFVRWGEVVEIEVDTKTETAIVVPS